MQVVLVLVFIVIALMLSGLLMLKELHRIYLRGEWNKNQKQLSQGHNLQLSRYGALDESVELLSKLSVNHFHAPKDLPSIMEDELLETPAIFPDPTNFKISLLEEEEVLKIPKDNHFSDFILIDKDNLINFPDLTNSNISLFEEEEVPNDDNFQDFILIDKDELIESSIYDIFQNDNQIVEPDAWTSISNKDFESFLPINESLEPRSSSDYDVMSLTPYIPITTEESQEHHRVCIHISMQYHHQCRTVSGCITSVKGLWAYLQDTHPQPPNDIRFHLRIKAAGGGVSSSSKTKWKSSNVEG